MEAPLQILTTTYQPATAPALSVDVSYRLWGQPLGTAPLAVFCHTLTSNSLLAGPSGWWNKLVGEGLAVDLRHWSVLCLDVPGNGAVGTPSADHLPWFNALQTAEIFDAVLLALHLKRVEVLLGASVGGGVALHMAALSPERYEKVIVVASDYRSSDWLVSHCQVQEALLQHPVDPIGKARAHAMLSYRTMEGINNRFKDQYSATGSRASLEWLDYHGQSLKLRMQLEAYRRMNHVLRTIDVPFAALVQSHAQYFHIATASDGLFSFERSLNLHRLLLQSKVQSEFLQLESPHGHDGFLIENQKMYEFLKPLFTYE